MLRIDGGALCTHLPPQQEALIAASASIINCSQWFPSFGASGDNVNHSILHVGFCSREDYEPFCLWPLVKTDGSAEEIREARRSRGSLRYPTWSHKSGVFPRVWCRSVGWHMHRQGGHKVGLFYLNVCQLISLKYWSAVADSPLQKYQNCRKLWPRVELPNLPTQPASASLCRIFISVSLARWVTQGSDPIKSERLFCVLHMSLAFIKRNQNVKQREESKQIKII